MPKPGIFCLEGEWDSNMRQRDSVAPVLDLLERLRVAQVIHRDVATKQELWYYLKRWCQKGYDDFSVLSLVSHGDNGCLDFGHDKITLDEIAEFIDGRARGRVIYFGSCLTLAQVDEDLTGFVKRAGAKAVVGYSKVIPWLESAAFEVLLLDRMLRNNRSDAFFNHLVRDHGDFANNMGLVVATKAKVMGV